MTGDDLLNRGNGMGPDSYTDSSARAERMMVLSSFFRLGSDAAALLIPLFKSAKSDEPFVQSVDSSERIVAFCSIDLDLLEHDAHINFRGELFRQVGDEAVLAILLPRRKTPLIGTFKELRQIIKSIEVEELPAFMQYEIASMVNDEEMLARAIEVAASTFIVADHGLLFKFSECKLRNIPQSSPTSRRVFEMAWDRVRGRLRDEVGEAEYRIWLRQMTLAEVTEDEVTIVLPTRFLRDWVRKHYGDSLRALWQAELPSIRGVKFRVMPESRSAEPRAEALPQAYLEPRAEAERDGRDLAGPLDPRFTFDSFVVGKPNEFAYACARRVAEGGPIAGFNPLFLYGGVGLGKTHLMHAIAWAIRERAPARAVAYMSSEKFMYRFVAAIRSQSSVEFKETLRGVDVLMIDDLQFLVGQDFMEEEFFRTFNALVDAGKQIVVSVNKPPSDLSGIEERLRTRLGCGMVADIHATTYELRIGILQAKAALQGVSVPQKVMEFMAKITTNVRDLEGALNRVVAHAQLVGRPITLESTQEVLHDLLRAHDRRVTIEEIQKRVAEHFSIRLTDMSSARRARAAARPRQIAMFLAKQLTSRSLPEIGRKFGNRDRTTVMRACSRVAELMQKDPALAEDVELLRRMLET